MKTQLSKFFAESILTVITVGLMGNAWAVWNDLQALKVREPITLEDIKELKADIKDIKTMLINQGRQYEH